MAYEIGISTGFYKIARAPELLGMAAKIAYGAVAGVQFVQIDMESTSEFYEPELKEQVMRVREGLGMKVGLHGEIGGDIMSVDTALLDTWTRTHTRLCETVRRAAELKMVYVNVHLSAHPQLLYEESRYRIQGYFHPVVDFFGRPVWNLADQVPLAKKIAIENIPKRSGAIQEEAEDVEKIANELRDKFKKKEKAEQKDALESLRKTADYQGATPASRRMLEASVNEQVAEKIRRELLEEKAEPEFIYKLWKASPYGQYILENAEIGAYEIAAAYMKEKGDPMWSIYGKSDVRYPLSAKEQVTWNAAIAGKYLWGHVMLKDNPANREHLEGLSVKEFCEKNKMQLLFEVPESNEGVEGLYRLFDPKHAYEVLKAIGSPYVKMTIDFEHMLAQKLNPEVEVSKWPNDIGKYIGLFHLGRPIIGTPGTTHAQIPLGSRAQELIYKWVWQLKQKGFEDGYMIYERGGGNTPLEVIQQSVQVLRQIKQFLDKDVNPNELPPEFFGISPENPEVYTRQLVQIRDNAYNPITGLLMIPEEAHTFLGRAAVEKGKAEEWKRGKFR
jgi:sugar phosphate isomerase/epimerase